MKHINTLGPAALFLLLALMFGFQAPRAANIQGTIIVASMCSLSLIAALIFVGKYERTRLYQGKVPQTIKFNPVHDKLDYPAEDGVYAVRYITGHGNEAYQVTAIAYFTEGKFLNVRHQIIGWAGPYKSPEDIINDRNQV